METPTHHESTSAGPTMRFLYEIEGENFEYEVTKPVFIIGRDPKCDFPIRHKSVSKKHARCTVEGKELLVQDLGSSNGTQINGRRIVEAYLSDRDVLEVGLVKLLFRVEEEEEEEEAPSTISGMVCELVLKIKSPNYKKKLTFPPQTVTIGAHSQNDVPIKEVGVSRFHAEITPTPTGGWVLKDLGSRNGTKVNGQPIQQHVLKNGDVLQIGAATIEVQFRMVNLSTRPKKQGAKPPLHKNPIILGLFAVILIFLLLPTPSSEKKNRAKAVTIPEHTQRYHKTLEEALHLWDNGERHKAHRKIKKLLKQYPSSELIQILSTLMDRWLEFVKMPFHFKEWGEIRGHMKRLALVKQKYLQKWEDISYLPRFIQSFQEQIDLAEKGRSLFLAGQIHFKNQNYEAALEKFRQIPRKSIYYRKALEFIRSKHLEQRIYLRYMKEVRRLEQEAHNSPEKYLAAIELLEELKKRYVRKLENLRTIQQRIRANRLNRAALLKYLRARNLLNQGEWEKAKEVALQVPQNSKYWDGPEGAARIAEFAQSQLDFKKAQQLYNEGFAEQSLQILDKLIERFGFEEVKKIRKHVSKVLTLFRKAEQYEKEGNLYLAIKLYKEVFQKEVSKRNRYHQLAYERHRRILRRIRNNAEANFQLGKQALSQGQYSIALKYFREVQDYDLDGKYFVKIQGLIQQREQDLYRKAQDYEISTYAYSWKQALSIYKLLVLFLPQESPLRQKAQRRIEPLEKRLALEKEVEKYRKNKRR